MSDLKPNTIYEYWFDKGASRGWSQTHLFVTDDSGRIPAWTSCGVWISRLGEDEAMMAPLGNRMFTKFGSDCGRCAKAYDARSIKFEQETRRSNLPKIKARRSELQIIDRETSISSFW